MREYVITTDSTVDLPKEYLREHQVQAVSLSYEIEGETYEDLNGLEPAVFMKNAKWGNADDFSGKSRTSEKVVRGNIERRKRHSPHCFFFRVEWKL